MSLELHRTTAARPVDPTGALTLLPVALTAAALDPDGFWGRRQLRSATASLAHCAHWMERVGWLNNFDLAAAGGSMADRRGREFSDSDVHKLLEAICWQRGHADTPELGELYDGLVARIVPAQEADGYLNTRFGRPGQDPRWSDLEWGHELYVAGHLLQAAVARLRTGGEDAYTRAAQRVADQVCQEFGPDARPGICGHPVIELGLVELARATGETRYRDQAALFLDRRGHQTLADIEFGRAYFQDDLPIRDAEVLRGHAVRALYLAAAAVDVAVDTKDSDLLATLERQWERTIAARTYLTGGMGSHHQDEAFGDDHVLPADRAYCETCAGVASIMFAWRLLLATGHPRYADLIERTLFNVVATSPADDGQAFFYVNTLHQRVRTSAPAPDTVTPRAAATLRSPWFSVSCCPTNVARTLAAFGASVATVTEQGVQLHQYTPGSVVAELPHGPVRLQVRTDYPRTGTIRVHVQEAPEDWTLTLRVPHWAHGAVVEHAGQRRDAQPGTVEVAGPAAGTEVVLTLPMTPRFTEADPRVDGARGTVAVERGPLVYCLESVDLPDGAHVDDVVIDPAHRPVDEPVDESTDQPPADVADVAVVVRGRVHPPVASGWPYSRHGTQAQASAAIGGEDQEIRLVPYHRWARRGPGTMRVWLRTS